MEKQPIKLPDIIDLDKFNRDAEMVKATIRLLQFLNFITFKIFEERLLVQLDILMDSWRNQIKSGYYSK